MSAETKAALDAAIAAHVADVSDGAILTAYVLQTRAKGFTDEDDGDKVRVNRMVAEGQDFITTMGLAAFLDENMRYAASHDD